MQLSVNVFQQLNFSQLKLRITVTWDWHITSSPNKSTTWKRDLIVAFYFVSNLKGVGWDKRTLVIHTKFEGNSSWNNSSRIRGYNTSQIYIHFTQQPNICWMSRKEINLRWHKPFFLFVSSIDFEFVKQQRGAAAKFWQINYTYTAHPN